MVQESFSKKSIQDCYTDDLSYCYGCGRMNEHGLQIKSYWDGDESVCKYRPKPYHTAVPGFVYGGLIACIIDCHSTGTAAAAMYRAVIELYADRPWAAPVVDKARQALEEITSP